MFEGRLEATHLLAQRTIPDRTLDREHDLVDIECLVMKSKAPARIRRDGGLERAECRHDDDRNVAPVLCHALAEIDAVHPSHVQVRDDDVVVLLRQELEGLFGDGSPGNVEAVALELRRHRLAHRTVVIHEENAGHEGSLGR